MPRSKNLIRRNKAMQTGEVVKRWFIWVFLGALLVAAAGLLACGGGGSSKGSNTTGQTQLFVADTGNNRVLLYNSPFATGQSAATVLGQASFTTNTAPANPTAASMNFPVYLAVASTGTLYVVDSNNCRVLQFSSPFATGMAANLAIGQPSGTTNLTTGCSSGNASATNLDQPSGVAIDSAGNLWVTDSAFARVLKYPAPIIAGETATVVLGQANFGPYLPSLCTGSASGLCHPGGLTFDSAGNLWVADSQNHRVVMYAQASLGTNGASASVVLGQPSFGASMNTANNGGLSATSLDLPTALAFDSAGNLWVADTGNNRVLMYPKASLATNGAAATLELGQPAATAFSSNSPGVGQSLLTDPLGLAFDSSGNLYVTDGTVGSNSRTLVFAPPLTTSGMNASLVLGQTNFTTGTQNTGGVSAATQSTPVGVATSF
jgi:hypothetical protein